MLVSRNWGVHSLKTLVKFNRMSSEDFAKGNTITYKRTISVCHHFVIDDMLFTTRCSNSHTYDMYDILASAVLQEVDYITPGGRMIADLQLEPRGGQVCVSSAVSKPLQLIMNITPLPPGSKVQGFDLDSHVISFNFCLIPITLALI
jgi:hypothetical protein